MVWVKLLDETRQRGSLQAGDEALVVHHGLIHKLFHEIDYNVTRWVMMDDEDGERTLFSQ